MTLPTLKDTKSGILLMMLAIFCFAAMDAAAKGLIARYPVPQVVWARFAGQVLIVALLLGPRLPVMLRTQWPGLHLIRSACQLGAIACFFSALPHIGLAEATALADLNPVLITLGAALFLGERLGPRRLAGVVAALIGALIIIRPGLSVFTPAALLPLASAAFYSVNALLTRRLGPLETAWTPMLLAALFGMGVTTLTLPFVWVPVAMADWPLFALIGILGSAAQLALIRAFTLAEAGSVAPFAYVGLIFATGWGYVLYNEVPDLPTVIGALVIVVAGLYVWHRETRVHGASRTR
ncbi:DMT family transporter [Pseudotabrizicola alkalilacus]|uniref:DMT family transporter n=1 Tax=Pseudotabrizicola alkalilacus TaxID=2305252 RepID=A0A411Z406_9RHOB|nr:DMT family transporter [Pseudotabrizicola alkalilacus]RGP37791.1 DMT family transporter [Pseudotabrizicola alkalilacus]